MMSHNNKVLVLGIDGLDPKLTKKYVDEGYMPNMKKFLEMGAAREDLQMIGGHPTVTPPMWTTLATGANPCTHGITEYYACDPERLDVLLYNFDSTRCQAEPLWNVAAEAGKKTLVWHWPGSSWPPTTDSENLTVVDGTQPAGPNVGVAERDAEKLLVASVQTERLIYGKKAATDSQIPCFIPGMEIEDNDEITSFDKVHAHEVTGVALTSEESYHNLSDTPFDICFSPIKEASNWVNAPEGAKECVLLNAGGKIHRPCLILKNDDGVYDRIAIYKNKKSEEPIVVAHKDVFIRDVIDEAYHGENKISVNRNLRLIDIAEDGGSLRLWVSAGMDFEEDTLWQPKHILKDVVEHVGCPQPVSMAGGSDERLISKCVHDNWSAAADWNAKSIKYLIETAGYELVFSHFHNVDLQGHLLVKFLYEGSEKLSPEIYQRLFRDVYIQTDDYIGEFLTLVEQGWTILIVSDHGQVCPEHGRTDFLPGTNAVNAVYFTKLGYMTMKKDEDGNDTHEIDWEKTVAVPQRCSEIYINLKGRNPHGIVDPADQYDLEEKIMTDMYKLVHPKTGHRIISLALRNRDAVLLGMGGSECGDIVYFVAEGYNDDHADSLSTMLGTCDTSVASVFAAAGPGIKKAFQTERMIKHVDVTPTVAVLAGLKMPAQCEGAPVYQILE
ncbi:MAG: alkaline phosphatase family protein [Peptococcaceae bacterium]|nr:alkaline phosphatase family protein [Peptococcaceae bacterium]